MDIKQVTNMKESLKIIMVNTTMKDQISRKNRYERQKPFPMWITVMSKIKNSTYRLGKLLKYIV